MAPLLTLAFPRTPTVPWEIRNALDKLARDVPASILPTARLLASELASNAVRHGAGDEIRISVLRTSRSLLVEVVDEGHGFEVPAGEQPDECGGWGLRLVDTLADRWGVEEGSTHVWFELALPRGAS